MWTWWLVGGVILGLPVLVVLWSLLVMAGKADDEMKDHRLENNKDHRLEACATKQT
jgi:hypothetical protein